MCFAEVFFAFIQIFGPGTDSSINVVVQFLQEDAPYWSITGFCVEVIMSLILRLGEHWWQMSFSCKVHSAVNFSVFNGPNFFACSFQSLAVSGEAKRATLGTNLRKTLHNPTKEQGSARVVGVLRSRVASVVCLMTSNRPGRIK